MEENNSLLKGQQDIQSGVRFALWMLLGSLALLSLLACASGESSTEQPMASAHGADEATEDVELALLMAHLQRYSHKLGYSVRGQNRPLAEFYLEELGEVLKDVEAIDEYEGMPISRTADVILKPLIQSFSETLAEDDWTQTWTSYEQLITGCNRCHMATEHGFVLILPADGEPPYNQNFDAR